MRNMPLSLSTSNCTGIVVFVFIFLYSLKIDFQTHFPVQMPVSLSLTLRGLHGRILCESLWTYLFCEMTPNDTKMTKLDWKLLILQ